MQLLNLKGEKWLWSEFGCQTHSNPIQKDYCTMARSRACSQSDCRTADIWALLPTALRGEST